MYALTNVRLYDYVTYRENAYLLFDEDILEVGDMADFVPSLVLPKNIFSGRGQLLMPGLINFHTHIYSAFARGCNFGANPHSFTDVLEQIWWRLDAALTPEALKIATIAYGRESLKKGVVALVDHNASGGIKGALTAIEEGLEAIGMHGTTCFEVSDRYNTLQAIEENVAHTSQYGGLFGLHASMTLCDETLKACKGAIGNLPIHVHVSESVDDHFAYNETPVERLSRFGLISENSLLVHGVHLTDDDVALLKSKGAKVAIAMRSNLNNAVGVPNVSLFLKQGVPILAGTDGLGASVAGSWQDIYYMTKHHSQALDSIDLSDVQRSIVDSYSIYEKWTGKKLGRFEMGYRMDAALYVYDAYTPMDASNAFGHVFFGVWDALDVVHMWVGGRVLIWEREHVKQVPLQPEKAVAVWKQMGGYDEHTR